MSAIFACTCHTAGHFSKILPLCSAATTLPYLDSTLKLQSWAHSTTPDPSYTRNQVSADSSSSSQTTARLPLHTECNHNRTEDSYHNASCHLPIRLVILADDYHTPSPRTSKQHRRLAQIPSRTTHSNSSSTTSNIDTGLACQTARQLGCIQASSRYNNYTEQKCCSAAHVQHQHNGSCSLSKLASRSSQTAFGALSAGSDANSPSSTSLLSAGDLTKTRYFSSSRSMSTSIAVADISQTGFGAPPAVPQHRVVVTGIGLVTPLGVGVQRSWQQLVAGHIGIRGLTPDDLPEWQRTLLPSLPSRVAGKIPGDELQTALDMLKEDSRRYSPFILLGMLAAEEALTDAQWRPASPQQQEYTGVCFGNGMSSTSEVADTARLLGEGQLRRVSPFFVPRILPNMAAGAISIRYRLQGPNHACSTACATGAHAIGDAFRMIQLGDAKVMIAGASELCIDALSLGGFSRLRALSIGYNDTPARASRPFDADRDGFVMGEGAGALVLEDLEHAQSRGAHVYAEVRGYGLSGDGYHITSPHPKAAGAKLCMRRALTGSGLAPSDVAYINAHATSTPMGDEIELQAIHDVFSLSHNALHELKVSSTKGATGHLLGAAGAVEAAFTILALKHGTAPPTANLEKPDCELLPGLVRTQAVPLRSGPKAAMCNSFGFGGTNACVLFASPP